MHRAHSGSLVAFFLLTYAVMGACFITVAAARVSEHSAVRAGGPQLVGPQSSQHRRRLMPWTPVHLLINWPARLRAQK